MQQENSHVTACGDDADAAPQPASTRSMDDSTVAAWAQHYQLPDESSPGSALELKGLYRCRQQCTVCSEAYASSCAAPPARHGCSFTAAARDAPYAQATP